MSFGHPLLLLTLLVVPAALALYLLAERRRMRYAIRYTNIDVLASVAGGRAWRRGLPLALFLVALAALCVATARPHRTTLASKDRATVVLVIDVSGSMGAKDVKPTRLAAAEAAARTFLDKAPKRMKVGLIVFAGEPQLAAPPTTDRDLVRQAIGSIGEFSGFGGTAIGDALAMAVQVAEQSVNEGTLTAAGRETPTHGLASILFLSDGAQTRGDLLPAEGAQRAKAAGIPVYTVALGTPNGVLKRDFGPFGSPLGGGGQTIPVPPDPATLNSIAEATGGQFFAATSAPKLQAAYARLGSSLGRKRQRTEVTYAFVAGAAALLVASGLLSGAWAPRLP
jgi:Ca-activated chloride channel family protein